MGIFVTDKSSKTRGITTEIPRSLYERLEAIAKREGKTKAGKVRELIDDAVEKDSTP